MKTNIKITVNEAKRTFTIRRDGIKYRTFPIHKVLFELAKCRTNNDWQDFIPNNDGEFYKVEKTK